MKLECPKCKRMGWLEATDESELVHRCLCGLHKVLYTEYKKMILCTVEVVEPKSIPRQGSLIERCMRVIIGRWPNAVTSEEVYRSISLKGVEVSRSDVSTRLMILQHKGLIEKIVNGKGKVGGSVWEVTEHGANLYKLGEW